MKTDSSVTKVTANLEDVIAEPPSSYSNRKSWRTTLTLAFGSLGAVYGDIGTSPMYVMNSIQVPNANNPSREDVYGMCSLIFWLFVILVFTKYALIVLNLGANDGEGGQIAIYTKIARKLHYGNRGLGLQAPGSSEVDDLEVLRRMDTIGSEAGEARSWKENPKVCKAVSLLSLALGFVGCALVLSDGLLTPTTTALTAVGGIQVAVPTLTAVVGISEAILVFLFLMQYLGSARLSFLFAPIMGTWLLSMAGGGIYNIAKYDPTIFRSLSPHYAVKLMQKVGIDAMGGAMLAITGTEAMFADLGHFGKRPIQIGIAFTLICLTLTYLGQGAYLTKYPQEMPQVFYTSLPGGTGKGFYWFMFVLGILSTVVASQALILGVFSILQQLINLDCFPKLKVWRISRSVKGKVFIPVANLLLFAGVVACTAAFKNSNNVTAAYGLGISLDFVITSSLLAICMLFVYDLNPLWVAAYVCIFVPLEMCLVISNIKKIAHGAWFPLMMCGIFTSIFTFWWFFRSKTVRAQISNRVRLGELFPEFRGRSADEELNLMPSSIAVPDSANTCTVVPLSKSFAPNIMIIYSDTQHQDMTSPNTFPGIYASILRNFNSLPPIAIFCTLKSTGTPVVDAVDRVLVAPTKIRGHYKAVVRFGFTEEFKMSDAILKAIQKEINLEQEGIRTHNWQVLHVFERNSIRSRPRPKTRNVFRLAGYYIRRCLIEQIFNPINSAYQNDDRVVSDQISPDNKLFAGAILRV